MPYTPGIPLRTLVERLEQLNVGEDPAGYERFARDVVKAVREKQALTGRNALPVPASSLTENQVFQYFELENERREFFDEVTYDVPRYNLQTVQDMIPFDLEFPIADRLRRGSPADFLPDCILTYTYAETPLVENLKMCSKTFDRRSEQYTRTAISLVLMEVVSMIHKYQRTDPVPGDIPEPTPANPNTLQPPDQGHRPVTPETIPQTFPRKPLKIFSEYTANYKLQQYDGSTHNIGGRFDLAVGYDGEGSGSTPLSALLFVVVLKSKQESLDKAFPQLLAYMAMTYRTRQAKLKRNHNVYGLITNWLTWQFAMIEDNILHKSNVLVLTKDLPLIMQFLGRTLLASALQTPTSSPFIFTGSVVGGGGGLQHIDKFRQSVLEDLFEFEVVDVGMD